jgi:serine/threonine protein kinase
MTLMRALMIGTTISHYRILEKLGGGGMGVVYKAEDTKLKRTVALKFLPPELTLDPEAKERFMHEAQAASALQHNNICAVHDIDQSPDGQMFIVMDCYEGETLKKKIERGRLKIEEATDLAIQIAQGLAKAHESGIVHRDIKPANIMITRDGVAKIVDFGLAKLSSATKLTKTGSTLGTVAYMAPEQLQGSGVDARADIFSLGVVLYEMLTGKTPFRGDHEAALMYSILNEEPEPLQTHIPDVSSEMIHIVSRALEKDPASRYKTMDDLLIDLRRIKRDTSKVFGTATYSTTGHKFLKKRGTVVGVTAMLLVVAAIAILFVLRNRTPRLNPNRTTVLLQIPFKEITSHAMSRDGNWLAFSAKDENGKEDIYWMNTEGGKPSRLTDEYADLIRGIDLSPNASQIAYGCFKNANPIYKVKLISTQGGGSRTLADTGSGPKWRPDGQRIGYIRAGKGTAGFPSISGKFEIWSIKLDGSDRRLELTDTLSVRVSPWSFCWSPDGGSIAWVRNYPGGYGEVMVRELATGRERQLTSDKEWVDEVAWAANDQILFVSRRSGVLNLWMIQASGGNATQITQGGVPIVEARISGDNSTVIYKQMERSRHIWTSALDGSNTRQVTSDDVQVKNAAFSPDGKQIAYVFSAIDVSSPEAHLYVIDRNGKNQRQLTSGSESVGWCRWSPDGKWIAYGSSLVGESPDSTRVYLIQPFNPGAPRFLYKGAGLAVCRWVDSEKVVTYDGMKTYLYSIKEGTRTQLYQDSTSATPIKGTNQLFVADFRKGREGRWVISVDALGRQKGEAKMVTYTRIDYMAPFGFRFLILMKQGGELTRLWTSTGKEEHIGKAPFGSAFMHDVSMDGKELLWLRQYDLSKLMLVKNVFE